MIGVLFHGPEVFDSGWAARVLRAFPRARFMLAGTMSRTALHDSGLEGVAAPGLQPSRCVKLLGGDCSAVLLATCSKSVRSGLVFGSLVAGRAGGKVPLAQAEFSGPVYSVHSGKCPASLLAGLKKLGLAPAASPESRIDLWHERGLTCRRMTTAEKNDYVLVNGIIVGRAEGGEIVLSAKGRSIVEMRGLKAKAHGLEKLERLGGVDLASAKLASAARLRSPAAARVGKSAGDGVVFIDHAGMHVYSLAAQAGGAVTVGDDTTAVCGDILRRFGVPVIGIVDGDGDGLHPAGGLAPGSTVFTVKADDKAGVMVREKIFSGKERSGDSFREIKTKIAVLIKRNLLSRADY
ncbi:MAG: DUF2117 domain-containing protein [Elusimicrobiales bacterium]